ncbi:hypothetical protein L1987_16070 [Smallanthus sonchifolius]|uniref:Uncharacterized protein n=1 Tax=Smallanthus sonchifolius TaxID=185202 RepID=A0ACB9J9I8_9ASTR|nr:hypothetical protein L1987_16070 [Smallanthus sonchifolius]
MATVNNSDLISSSLAGLLNLSVDQLPEKFNPNGAAVLICFFMESMMAIVLPKGLLGFLLRIRPSKAILEPLVYHYMPSLSKH